MSKLLESYRTLIWRQYRWWIAGLVALCFAELFAGIVEKGLGRYLVWQNPGRQAIGRSWEAAQSRLLADTRVEAAQQEQRRRSGNLASLTDFEQLLNYLRTHQQALLPLSQFADIYRSLPEIFQALWLAPDQLWSYVRERRAKNALCMLKPSSFEIFLMDAQDQAVYQSQLSSDQLEMISRHGREQRMDVNSTSRFAERVFEAEVFHRAVERLPDEPRAWLVRQLPILTEPEDRFLRFAVADHMAGGFVEVAFTIDPYRTRLYFLPDEWFVEFLWPALNESRFD